MKYLIEKIPYLIPGEDDKVIAAQQKQLDETGICDAELWNFDLSGKTGGYQLFNNKQN